MILKQVPEDFIVEEKYSFSARSKGKYCICELKKKNFNTEDAVLEVASQLSISRKNIGYAGNKDRNAVTTQRISVLASYEKVKVFNHKDLSLKFLGFSDEPVSLGMLLSNKFVITVRSLSGEEIISDKKIINYFHKQRFSENNVEIGKYLLKKDYESAVELLKNDFSYGKKIESHLDKSVNDFVGALRTIPKKILTLYVHAYQSYLWNKAVKELKEKDCLPEVVPLPGFSDFEASKEASLVLKKIMMEENLSKKDFLNRDIPWLSVEGTVRKTISEVKNLDISNFLEDELNIGKKKVIISFELGKGEYATNVVEQLFLEV